MRTHDVRHECTEYVHTQRQVSRCQEVLLLGLWGKYTCTTPDNATLHMLPLTKVVTTLPMTKELPPEPLISKALIAQFTRTLTPHSLQGNPKC